ncbi:MAG: acyl-CoA thioesterase II, partial [Pseudomonadota bacterium]|nr:acyl-CoA thioesterase II [Pseudomonadota bacterium]
FEGMSPGDGWKRVFGGQVVAQALLAATRTVLEERPVHSLHGYFLRPGDPALPIVYEIDPHRDGKSFTTRGVLARQNGEIIFSMIASFHRPEPGFDHQVPMPDVPAPESLPDEASLITAHGSRMPPSMVTYLGRRRAVELRPTDPEAFLAPQAGGPARANLWLRVRATLPDEDAVHCAALAYASDISIIATALVPHGRTLYDQQLMMASLDHAIWYHRPFRADQWLLYSQDSPSASGARGFNRGLIFDRAGALIASVTQEGLMRLKAPAFTKP